MFAAFFNLVVGPDAGLHLADVGFLQQIHAQTALPDAAANRIRQLCKERGITPNGLSNLAAVPQATVKSILNGESQNPGTVTIKKLCDRLEITLGEFFSTPEFNELEQEIK